MNNEHRGCPAPSIEWSSEIRWTADGKSAAGLYSCPLCGDGGPHDAVLSLKIWPADSWGLYRCSVCGTLAFPDGRPGDYGSEWISPSFQAFRERRYVELGAALDVIFEPLHLVPREGVSRYLEVGAGYGFSVDYAQRRLGWDAYGVDPAPEAARGASALGWRLIPRYLDSDLELPGGVFDLVLASEVIEHVADPHAFLTQISPAVGPKGTLIITTPDAEVVTPALAGPDLTSVLAPGWHLVLFTRDGLARLLAEHGFRQCHIRREGLSLIAVASRGGHEDGAPPRLPRRLDRACYQAYLQERRQALQDDPSLSVSLTFRLYKDFVNEGRFEEAGRVLADLNAAYHRHFGIDFSDPEGIGIDYPSPVDDAALTRLAPMNLPAAAYFRAIHAQLGERDNRCAERYFRLAAAALEKLHGLFESVALPDGEAGDLLERIPHNLSLICPAEDASAVFGALDAVARCGRDLALAQQRALSVLVNRGLFDAADAMLAAGPEGASVDRYAESRARCRDINVFVTAVNGGDHGAAGAVAAVDYPRERLEGSFAGVLLGYHQAIMKSLTNSPEPEAFAASAAGASCLYKALRSYSAATGWAEEYYTASVLQELLAWRGLGKAIGPEEIAERVRQASQAMSVQVAENLRLKVKVSKM